MDTEAKTDSHHTVDGFVSVTKNESTVRVHPDKNHVTLTEPPSALLQTLRRMRGLDVYIL